MLLVSLEPDTFAVRRGAVDDGISQERVRKQESQLTKTPPNKAREHIPAARADAAWFVYTSMRYERKETKMRSIERAKRNSAMHGTIQWICSKGAVQAKRNRDLSFTISAR